MGRRRARPGARVHERGAHSGPLSYGPPPESYQAYMGPRHLDIQISEKFDDDFDVDGQLDSIAAVDVEVISNFSEIFMTKVTVQK